MSNIVPSSDSSGFSKSDLALIKNGQWLPELSHFIPVTSPRNLDDNLNHARDEGEKIDLLIHTALNPYAPALVGLGEFLNSRDVTILAATLRGFASIGETLKEKKLDPDHRNHLEQIRYVLTANLDLNDDDDPSVHLFKRLCHDAESGGSEMVRWAAAYALQELDYPLNLRRQLLSRPPAEIVAEIWSRYVSRLADGNRQKDPSKVLEDVKFGIYGDTKKLFDGCGGGYSLYIARQVLEKSGVRGIRLAIECANKPVVETAINFAGELFNQIDRNSQDKRYVDTKTRQRLVDLLLPFIDQPDLELRNLVAEKLNDKRNNYNVSNSLITLNYRAKVAVVDTDWNRAISLRDVSIPVLCEAVKGSLKIELNENSNTNCQIEAVKAINKILTDVSRKVSTLSSYLQHDNNAVRLSVANLLKPHKNSLDTRSAQIISALLFELNLPHESNTSLNNSQLNKSTVESYIRLAETHKQSVQDIFNKATSACNSNSTATKDSLSNQRKAFMDRIAKYVNGLNGWLQDYENDLNAKAKARAEELNRQNQELQRLALCKKLAQDKVSTKAQIQKLEQNIESTKKQREQYSTEISNIYFTANQDQVENLKHLLSAIFAIPFLIFVIGGAMRFVAWLILVATQIISWETLLFATNVIFALIWGGLIIAQIVNIISTASARGEKENLESRRNEASNQLTTLENQRNELQKQLNAIDNKMRDNKCS